MTHAFLGDVAVRARGLATHLLDRAALQRLARSSGTGALASALQDCGYWPAPTAGVPASPASLLERSIDHETLRRLGVLARWLAERFAPLAPLFDLEERDLVRLRLRELAGRGNGTRIAPGTRSGWPALRELRAALAAAGDVAALVRASRRLKRPWAEPLAAVLREHGDALPPLERELDRSWAARAIQHRDGGVGGFVEDEIDLHNAWSALAGSAGDDDFLAGGRALPGDRYSSIANEADESRRRRELAHVFREGSLAGVFDDPAAPAHTLEARARAARIAGARRAARLDPMGADAIVEVVLRVRSERADLRCIGFGVAAGLPHAAIVDRLGATP